MNLIQIPFHDLRKIAVEGHRTRDAHLMESFARNSIVDKLLIIDRPTTFLEILLKKKPKNVASSRVLKSKNGMQLIEMEPNVFAITYISNDILGQIVKKKKWFRQKMASQKFVDFVNDSIEFLKMNDALAISNNIFACDLLPKVNAKKHIFDAWDDFAKIGNYGDFKDFIINCYQTYAQNTPHWTTNAEKNKISFEEKYKVKNIDVIENGVDEYRFFPDMKRPLPKDLEQIQSPIYGFGGKITHLINPELMKTVAENNPDKNFVFVGQNMVPEILNHFNNLPNVHFLGDKHYDEYINYLANFDVCLVPYVDDQKSSGANTIKVYEYLAMGKKVVGTLGNGLEKLQDYLYAAKNAKEFSEFLKDDYPNKSQGFDTQSHSWNGKVNQILDLY